MIFELKNVLTKEEVAFFLAELKKANWSDGKVTAGVQSAKVKNNFQVDERCPVALKLQQIVLQKLQANGEFVSYCLPSQIFPPLFNKYVEGQGFGKHIDNAVRQINGTNVKIRTDISATLFLSSPESYEGGELEIEDTGQNYKVKLEAGSMVIYPASTVHFVHKVKSGERIACFFWVESMVRSYEQRKLLYELDNTISIASPETQVKLTGLYHNLLRMWI